MIGRSDERGQSVVETIFVVLVLTFLLSAILQVFLVHNYAFQMANNAYYSLFKDKAYKQNDPEKSYFENGPPNYGLWKPLRSVSPWPEGGDVYPQSGNRIQNWKDDRASVPMMPFYATPIEEQMRAAGITQDPVRLKIGQYKPGVDTLDYKRLHIGAGTKGSYLLAVVDLVITLVENLAFLIGGGDYTDYTNGQAYNSEGSLGYANSQQTEMGQQGGSVEDDDGESHSAQDTWDIDHGDFNHDGRNDWTGQDTNRPWEDQQETGDEEGQWDDAW